MKRERILAGTLSAAILAGLLVLPSAAAGSSAFTDIRDADTAEAAELLRLLGVVDGTGGTSYRPNGTLTRAEFCKMAVDVMDKGGLEPAQRGRTIFLDVGARHWARGYVNLASSLTTAGELAGTSSGTSDQNGGDKAADRLIMGVGNGCFEPDRPITYGEAVAILTRILGWTTGDVAAGAEWYDGYLAVAAQSGLTDGLSLGGKATLTRGQAAELFRNLLFTDRKGGDKTYLESDLGGILTDDTVLISLDSSKKSGTHTVTVANGTDTRTPKTSRGGLSTALLGVRGEMVQDKDGKFLTLRPNEDDTIRRVTVSGTVDANYITASGEKITVDPDTVVWKDGEATTFEKVWSYLYNGAPVTLCYGPSGDLDYVYLSSASEASDDVMVARTKPNGTSNPFAALAKGRTDYQIYKNGVPASVSDLRQYDVATYDSGANIIQVSDLRLTAIYENASPNPTAPSKITVLGQEFTVLPGAIDDLISFRPGDRITLLFTSDGRVAGALSPDVARSTTVGVVEECSAGSAKIKPLLDFYNAKGEKVIFSGDPGLSESSAAKMVGQLVTISSGKEGRISLSRLTVNGGSSVSGSMDVAGRTIGGTPLSENVRMFERVGSGEPREIDFDQLTRTTVPASKILYARKDYAGKYDILVFDDVTGDQYDYGYAFYVSAAKDDGDSMSYSNATIAVKNGRTVKDGSGVPGTADRLVTGSSFRNGQVIGIAASIETLDGAHKLAGSVTDLRSASGVKRSAYDPDDHTLRVGDQIFPISQEVWCYNKTTGHWFTGETGYDRFEQVRAYSDSLTVWFDQSPEQGGKIRLVVVE